MKSIMIPRSLSFLLLLCNCQAWVSSTYNPFCKGRAVARFAAPGDLEAEAAQSAPLGYTLKVRNPYDVHVYFKTREQFEQALKLREAMKLEFPWMRFYSPKTVPIGPHPLPMWEADFGAYDNRDKLGYVVQFLRAHHGDLSIMIHPHSTDGDYADHTKHIIWFGTRVDLRIQGWQRS
jgi:aromatic ring-cleaving dioxygenase